MSVMKEFKEFVVEGNIVDMAVGILPYLRMRKTDRLGDIVIVIHC